ncbi:hypothetical protein Tco_0445000 [Tanacetum coccineum]
MEVMMTQEKATLQAPIFPAVLGSLGILNARSGGNAVNLKVVLKQGTSMNEKKNSSETFCYVTKKTENETEKGWEHFLGIKRWSVGMRIREV